jgi:hypothetical protein
MQTDYALLKAETCSGCRFFLYKIYAVYIQVLGLWIFVILAVCHYFLQYIPKIIILEKIILICLVDATQC